jgi:hypothetical protein
MRNYFEDAEYRRDILSKWNNLTLKSIMIKSENENKFIEKCLQLLIKNLRHLQHDLNSKLRSEKFIHNKLINACQNVIVCQYACFKFSDSLIDLINDLRSSIVIYQKANLIIETFEAFFIDRRYHKNFSSRINQNHRFQNRRFQNRSKRKCFVCQKEECWFTKHSKNEREIVKQKFKNRFFNQMNKRIDQYIFEYEETNFSSFYSKDDSDTDLIDEMKTLIMNLSTLSFISDNSANAETFIISFDLVQNAEIMITSLANRSLNHFLTNNLHINMKITHSSDLVHTCIKNIDFFTYIIIDRYTFAVFYEIMIDSKASIRSIVDYEQYLAFIKNISIDLDHTKTDIVNVQFEIRSTFSIESFTIDTSFELVKFHVIKADTFFLLSLADMNRLKVYFNNVENLLIDKIKTSSVIKRFDHDFLLWENFLHSYITQFFELNSCYLIDVELRQLHKLFDHSFITKLHDLLKRFDHEVKKAALKKLTKFCTFCQKYAKSSERFKFILKNDVNFNYSIIVDVMYIENHLILHVVDDVTRFQVAKWLQSINAKHIWNMLRLCWIDVYLSSSDHILTDADKNFASKEFRQFVISMTIIIKTMFVEAHWSIDVMKRYHAELRRAYQMIFENLNTESTISKEIILQMIVKAINDTVDSDDLMLILLIFETYPRMHVMNPPTSSITQRAMIIEKAMIEIKKFRAEHQIIDALNTRNDSIVISIHNLSLNSDVLVWRESNVSQRDKWTKSFKLLDIEDETCKIVLSSESIDFRSTVIKLFLIESINDVESINENVQSTSEDV